MAKRKNKSFVEMKVKENNNEENIINPLKQYEYIEPKKKAPIKQILLIIFTIIAITLVIILLKLIDNHNNDITNVENTSNNQKSTNNLNLLTTTTATTTSNENEKITETLICSSTSLENNLQIDTQVTANFHNNKLRSDINYLHIKLLDESAKDEFNNYITVLQMFSLYLMENSDYEITDDTREDEFSISIKTNYQENQVTESNLSYNEDYESVKQKLIELGHECQ